MIDIGCALRTVFEPERVERDVVLAPFTTFRVGGKADWFLGTRSSAEMVAALMVAHQTSTPVTILGGGSNVLISDGGVRGLVLRPRGGTIREIGRHAVQVDAAVTINSLVRWAICHGRAGLESWAGTPGTVGGAVHGNAHFGGRLIGELVSDVRLVDRRGAVQSVNGPDMELAYDRSRLQRTGEVVLSAVFHLSLADPDSLREEARRSLALRKDTQPLNQPNAGCIFQNPPQPSDPACDSISWKARSLIERAGLKGAAIGGASVSRKHANFVVNDGTATAADIRRLIDMCRETVRQRLGVELIEEIVSLGDC